MRKSVLFIFISLLSLQVSAQDITYFLPDSITYDNSIPKPKDIIFHEVGEWHVTHDRLVNYMRSIAVAAPERVKLTTIGTTYENRPQLLMVITSRKNHDNLEQIRKQHLLLSDPSLSSSLNIDNMPIVVYIGHSIHGNEPSGSNASLLTAYYLAAARGKQIDELLDNVIVLLDPSFNPDGLQRFSTWANQHRSKNLVTDSNSREFKEVWPGGRFNHYWFDLNRDWLPAVHPESQHRLKIFHHWKPNILTDHHEQASNSTFFFQPGVSSRINPLTPVTGQLLTEKLGKYHAQYLDRIGSMYFTKENFDDFYYGKGSTYPDINGGIGILFEQASSRGHAQQTSNGILRFPFTIKNQFITALSTLEGAKFLRKEFLEFQRGFFKQSLNRSRVSGYVFGDKYDKGKTFHFLEMLQFHDVAVNEIKDGWNDNEFKKGSAYVVSMNQPQQVVIKAIFEKQLDFKDSLFYDITSWTMPLAYGIPFREIDPGVAAGKILEPVSFPKGEVIGGETRYSYLFEWDELYAPRALFELQEAGILVKVTTNPFEINISGIKHKFDYGTIIIPVQIQTIQHKMLIDLLKSVAEKNALKIYAVQTGNVISGSDLGSDKMVTLSKPLIALLVGPGVNPTDAGEVWHLLDQRMNIPLTLLEISVFNRVDISKYNTIIMAGGSYSELNKEKMKSWVQAGGNLILEEEAVTWASQNGVNAVTLKKTISPLDSTKQLPYVKKEQVDGAQQMNGAIFEAMVDITHPLAYGYHSKTVSLFKPNRVFMEKSKNPYATPLYFNDSPLLSGWASKENMASIKNSAAVIVNTMGSGRVINLSENPVFRGTWFGSFKLLMNAIFFGKVINAASGKTE